jgi:hypothetical protein
VKCDETQPHCLRCKNGFFLCEGYRNRNPIQAQDSSLNALTRPLTAGIENEFQSIAFYLDSSKLFGPFETEFWTRYVPQIGYGDPAVHHAIVALSAFHRGLNNEQSTGKSIVGSTYHKIALQHYGMSMRVLQSRNSCTDEDSLLGVLISCLLFTILGCLMGNYQSSALVHLRSGLDILGNLRTARASKSVKGVHSALDKARLEEHLVHIFAELELQAAFVLSIRKTNSGDSPRQRLCIPSISNMELCTMFEAKHELENALSNILDFRQWSAPIRPSIKPSDDTELYERYKDLDTHLDRYSIAFQRFLSESQNTLSRDELHGAVQLKIKEKFARLVLDTTMLLPEDRGQLNHMHQSLLNMIESILDIGSIKPAEPTSSEEPERNAIHSMGVSIVMPLYFIVQWCTDMSLRSRAVELLSRCPREGGFWDSIILSRVAKQLLMSDEINQRMSRDLCHVTLENMSPDERSCILKVRTGINGSTVITQEPIEW